MILEAFFNSSIKRTKIFLFLVFVVACLLRYPGIKFDLEPFPYCDEDLFIHPAMNMVQNTNWNVPHFKSGGLNFLIPKLAGSIFTIISSEPLSTDVLRFISRLIATVLLASCAVFPLFGAINIQTASKKPAVIGTLLYALSPLSTSASTWFYPDGFIAFFSAATIYLSEKIRNDYISQTTKRLPLLFCLLGLTLGAAISTKYNAIILCGYPFIVLLLNYKDIFSQKKLDTIKTLMKFISLACLSLFLTFSVLNWGVFLNANQFFQDLKINHYSLSENYYHGWSYYASLYFLFSLGLIPLICLTTAKIDPKSFVYLFLKTLSIPILYLLIIGRYNLLYSRNIQIIFPFLVLFVSLCFEIQTNVHPKGKFRRFFFFSFTLFSSFLLFRTTNQFLQDLKQDSRLTARMMVKKQKWNEVYSNEGCGQARIIESTSSNPEYILLDNWFGGIDEKGQLREPKQENITAIFHARHFRDLHYLNHVGCWNWGLPFPFFELQQKYTLETQIKNGGPIVSVFRRKATQ